MESTLKDILLNNYPDHVPFQRFNAHPICSENFSKTLAQGMRYANIDYLAKKQLGMFYPEGYVKHIAPGHLSLPLAGLCNPHYFNLYEQNFFQGLPERSPSEIMAAFFRGPTFADCSSVLQACSFRAIEYMLGSDEFDRLFQKPFTGFYITPILFNPINTKASIHLPVLLRILFGNPLFFLFDDLTKTNQVLKENEIKPGDIVYIKGIDSYLDKHLAGISAGWSSACVGVNKQGEKLYSAFGPETFTQPLTYEQIRAVTVRDYNLAQTQDTLHLQATLQEAADANKASPAQLKRLERSRKLAKHTVADNSPIGGITHAIRFNPDKLTQFQCQSAHEPVYINPTDDFASHIINTLMQQADQPVIILFADESVNSRTSLSARICAQLSKQGKRSIIVDHSILQQACTLLSQQHNGKVPIKELRAHITAWMQNTDLIVADNLGDPNDILTETFINVTLNQAFKKRQWVIIAASEPKRVLEHGLKDYLGFDDPRHAQIIIFE